MPQLAEARTPTPDTESGDEDHGSAGGLSPPRAHRPGPPTHLSPSLSLSLSMCMEIYLDGIVYYDLELETVYTCPSHGSISLSKYVKYVY